MTMTISVHELPAPRHGAFRPLAPLPATKDDVTLALDTDSDPVAGPCAVCLRANADILWGGTKDAAPAETRRLMAGDREWFEIPQGVAIIFRATAAA